MRGVGKGGGRGERELSGEAKRGREVREGGLGEGESRGHDQHNAMMAPNQSLIPES